MVYDVYMLDGPESDTSENSLNNADFRANIEVLTIKEEREHHFLVQVRRNDTKVTFGTRIFTQSAPNKDQITDFFWKTAHLRPSRWWIEAETVK